MELDQRKKQILQAIIDAYIDTAEPIGSRTVSKRNDLGLSPATIRNEMADLEEMGFLEQPHTSAGRVPSRLGYRFYVNTLMRRYRLSIEEMEQLNTAMKHKFNEFDRLISHMTGIISDYTNYTTIASKKTSETTTIKRIEIVIVDETTFLLILITSSDIARSCLLRSKKSIDADNLALVYKALNTVITNRNFDNLVLGDVLTTLNSICGQSDVVLPMFNFICEVINGLSQEEIFLAGQKKILNYPEFRDIDRAREFLDVIDNKSAMHSIIEQVCNKSNTEIIIGEESAAFKLHDASIVVCRYNLGNQNGILGIIGPTRMDYARLLSSLEYFTMNLNKMLTQTPEQE